MTKSTISNLLRKLRLLYLIDHLHFYYQKFKNRGSNKLFKLNNPEAVLPPDYLIYESYQINYENYYNESINTAEWLIGYFEKYIELKNIKILEWGCGPGRILRHLSNLTDRSCELFGSDYNFKSIDWCEKHIPGVNFSVNNLQPPLKFQSNYFDIIYATSVFTHLSEEMHFAWFNDLHRVLKKQGILFITTHGDATRTKLTSKEVKKFDSGKVVIRGNVKEGHRTFTAYQPKKFMQNLFSKVEILDHVKREPEGKYIPQEIWIVRKN